MYQQNNMQLEKLKTNKTFIDSRIKEILEFISKQEASNQSVSPVTKSILELNKEMFCEIEKQLNNLDKL